MFYMDITLDGFGPYEKATKVTFSPGVNIISGVNESGKTTIIDAIHWALFGKIATAGTQFNRTSVVNNSSARARVILNLVSENYGEVRISRSLTKSDKPKHDLRVEVSGEEIITGVKKGQYKIIEVLSGLESDSFSASSMLISSTEKGVNDFIAGNATKRREILRDVADPMKVMESRNKEVRAELKEIKAKISKIEGEKESYERLLEELTPYDAPVGDVSELENRRDETSTRINYLMSHSKSAIDVVTINRIKDKIAELKERLESYKVELSDLTNEIASLREERETVIVQERNDKSQSVKIEARLEYLECENESGKYILSCLKERVSEINSLIASIDDYCVDDKTLEKLRNESKHVCIICGSNTEGKDLTLSKNNDHVHQDKKSALAELEECSIKIEEVQSRLDYVSDARIKLSTALSRITNAPSDIPIIDKEIKMATERARKINPLISAQLPQKISDLEEELSKYSSEAEKEDDRASERAEIEELKAKRKELDLMINDFNKDKLHYDDYVSKRDNYQAKLDDVLSRLKVVTKKNEELEDEKFLTSDKGKIAEDISKIMSAVSHSASQAFSTIFTDDKKLDIVLVASTENGTDDTCIITANDNDLSSYAHSKQLKIVVSIMLGITKAVSEHLSEWFPPLWDEPTIAMDEGFAQQFHKGLPLFIKGGREQAIIITRDDIDYLDNVNVINPQKLV